MSKRELELALEDIKEFLSSRYIGVGVDVRIQEMEDLINRLDEPALPVVPDFVAEWFEESKYYLEFNIHKLCIQFNDEQLDERMHTWFGNDSLNKPIETLIKMKSGYTIEEKKYLMPVPFLSAKNAYYFKREDGRIAMIDKEYLSDKGKLIEFTEKELNLYFNEIKHKAKDVRAK